MRSVGKERKEKGSFQRHRGLKEVIRKRWIMRTHFTRVKQEKMEDKVYMIWIPASSTAVMRVCIIYHLSYNYMSSVMPGIKHGGDGCGCSRYYSN